MSGLDRNTLAAKASAVDRHLKRVEARLPESPQLLVPSTDVSDAVILHLWQATQIVLDVGLALCVARGHGTPGGYADAFVKLRDAGDIEEGLAARLVAASGFRNVVAHAYETIDMERVFAAGRDGPTDLRAFLGRARDLLE